MATTAGQMTNTPSGNPQWRAANGAVIYGYQMIPLPFTARPHTGVSTGTYRDWVRRMGTNRTQGIGGFWIKLPTDPGATWFVTTADDSGDTAAGTTNDAMKPPAGVK